MYIQCIYSDCMSADNMSSVQRSRLIKKNWCSAAELTFTFDDSAAERSRLIKKNWFSLRSAEFKIIFNFSVDPINYIISESRSDRLYYIAALATAPVKKLTLSKNWHCQIIDGFDTLSFSTFCQLGLTFCHWHFVNYWLFVMTICHWHLVKSWLSQHKDLWLFLT